jgi:hypothetical protein
MNSNIFSQGSFTKHAWLINPSGWSTDLFVLYFKNEYQNLILMPVFILKLV